MGKIINQTNEISNVNVEIIKSGETIDNFTAKVDKNKIDYLN